MQRINTTIIEGTKELIPGSDTCTSYYLGRRKKPKNKNEGFLKFLCTQHLVAAYLETVKITLENPAALLYYTLCMSSIPLEYSIIYCKHSFLFLKVWSRFYEKDLCNKIYK